MLKTEKRKIKQGSHYIKRVGEREEDRRTEQQEQLNKQNMAELLRVGEREHSLVMPSMAQVQSV